MVDDKSWGQQAGLNLQQKTLDSISSVHLLANHILKVSGASETLQSAIKKTVNQDSVLSNTADHLVKSATIASRLADQLALLETRLSLLR